MKTGIIIFSALVLLSCKKETKQTTPPPVQPICDCYEYHEKVQLVGTFPTWQNEWVYDYETSPATDFCSKDDSVWNYNSNSTHRWRWICQ